MLSLNTLIIIGLVVAVVAVVAGSYLHLVVIPRRRSRLEKRFDPLGERQEAEPVRAGNVSLTKAARPVTILPPIGKWLPTPLPNQPLPPRVALQRDAALRLVIGDRQ